MRQEESFAGVSDVSGRLTRSGLPPLTPRLAPMRSPSEKQIPTSPLMKVFRAKFALVAVGLVALAAVSLSASNGQPLGEVNLQSFEIGPSTNGDFFVIRLAGTTEGLGKCTAYGETDFVPGKEADTSDGTGVIAFTSANGDMLVGVITAHRDSAGAVSAEVHWRDAVTLHDGTTVASSGRFEKHRPTGVRFSRCCCCLSPCTGCSEGCCP